MQVYCHIGSLENLFIPLKIKFIVYCHIGSLEKTGKEVENVKSKADVNTFALILDAIKGAIAALSDNDRDWLLTELLKNVKIDKGQSYIITATIDELNNELSGFKPILKLLTELVKINLGFL